MTKPSFFALGIVIAFCLSACDPQTQTDGTNTALSVDQQQRIAALSTQLRETNRRVQEVNDVLALKRLQYVYGYYLEKGLWQDVVALFSDSASIEFGNEGVYVGKERISEYFQRLFYHQPSLPSGKYYSQFYVMPLITVSSDGRSAKARWKDMVMKGEYGKSAYWGDGVSENEYVKENGVWLISKLHRYTTFIAPYDGGWKEAVAQPDISHVVADLPPDRSPTWDYQPFPGVFIPPYHPHPQVPADDPLTQGVMLPGDAINQENTDTP